MREGLYLFRCKKKLTKEKMAKKLGVSRSSYTLIENGVRFGTEAFWNAFQREFCISNSEMYDYMKKEQANETASESGS